MQGEVARLVDQLEQAVEGHPWHGDPVVSVIARASYAAANVRPEAVSHSIRDIVRHMTAWTTEVHRRMNGEVAAEPPGGDWPAPQGEGERAWAGEIDALRAAHRALVADLRKLTDEDLARPIRDDRHPRGEGVTRYDLLHGLAQHHAYHSGQIAILAQVKLR